MIGPTRLLLGLLALSEQHQALKALLGLAGSLSN
jgi:hypothetical protein